MTTLLKGLCAFVVVVVIALMGTTLTGQDAGRGQAPAPGAQGRGGRGAPAPPPEKQAGHGTGKLIIWGDLGDMARPGTQNPRCFNTNRFKPGNRAGFRMTAIDGGTGETENTAEMVVHVNYMGKTIDIPMRWRGVGGFPAAEYPRQPSEMWTGVWEVPMDAVTGTYDYTVTAKDAFGRTATFRPFPNHLTQLTIVEE